MPRSPRGLLAAGTYHVTTRSGGPVPIFIDDDDRTRFCAVLVGVLRRMQAVCRAFCFMSTHYHLLLDVQQDTLQTGMARLNGVYAQGFNKRHGRVGHLFGDRYHCVRVESDGHMLHLLRYLARNPVEAGLCATPSAWPWGSYRGCAGIDEGFPFVDSRLFWSYFSVDPQRATELIRSFVDET